MVQLRVFSLIVIVFGVFSVQLAQATQSNFSGWIGSFFQGKFSDHFGWYFENQVRLNEGVNYPSYTLDPLQSRGNRFMIRPAIRWLPSGESAFQVFLGYAWVPNFSPDRNENRLWQQALYQSDQEYWWWAQRVRFEERWVEGTDGTLFRIRYLARLHRYLEQERKLGVSIWDEVFWNINSVSMGPQSGFDQNRLFLGPHIRLNSQARFEVGYMSVYSPSVGSTPPYLNHVFVTYVYLDNI